MNLHINCIRGSLLFTFTFLLIFAAEAFGAVTINITAPANDTTSQTLPELNFTTSGLSNVTYNWNGEGNISGCRNCTSFNTTYGEYANSSEQNLVLAMHFNENFSTTAFDDSVNGNDGTLGNATLGTEAEPNWTTGKFGPALEFDGDWDFVQIPYSSSLDSTRENLTVMFWFKNKGASDNPWQYLIGYGTPTGNNNFSWYIMYNNASNKTVFWVKNPGVTIASSTSPDNSIIKDQWYFLAFTYDSSTGNLNTYLNGTNMSEATLSGAGNLRSGGGDFKVRIGKSYKLDQNWLNGTIDEVVILNRSLSASEIQGWYNRSLEDGQHNVTVYAVNSTGGENSTTRWFTVDTTAPTYSNVGRNSTEAGASTLFYAYWQDNIGLSNYIFSWNNSGTWQNDTP
ncbi:MAG: LamG domain-containing protein, partial [Candidatus Hydrothermarchaeaceae archaeon]